MKLLDVGGTYSMSESWKCRDLEEMIDAMVAEKIVPCRLW
jgi:hypothetical protein